MSYRDLHRVFLNGVLVGGADDINFVEGTGVTLTLTTYEPRNVEVTISATGGGGETPTLAEVLAAGNDPGGTPGVATPIQALSGAEFAGGYLEIVPADERNEPDIGAGGGLDLHGGLGTGGGLPGRLQLGGATRTDGAKSGGNVFLFAGEETSVEAGGALLNLYGGTNNPTDTGGDAVLAGGYTHDGGFDGAEVIAGGAADAADGLLAVKTDNSTGLAGQALVSDGAGKVVWGAAGPVEPCRVLSLSNIDLATGGLLTINTVDLINNDRVLVLNQSTLAEGGIYLAHVGAWTRAADWAAGATIPGGTAVMVLQEGPAYGQTYWVTRDDMVVGDDWPLLDQIEARNWIRSSTGDSVYDWVNLDLATSPIINMADPTDPQDAATKAYVDARTLIIAAGVPSGAPTNNLPFAIDTTAVTGGFYYWNGSAWVLIVTIP